MLELYKNDIQDLLLSKKQLKDPPKLKIRRDERGTVAVDGVMVEAIKTREDLKNALNRGHKMRKTASTKMNSESSRSHLLQIIHIVSTNVRTGIVTTGKLTLVDLAGSERAGKTCATGRIKIHFCIILFLI